MLMTSVVKLRIINMVGSLIFTGYAVAIHSYPTAIMNGCLVIINIFNLLKLLRYKKTYSVVKVCADDYYLNFFCRYYGEDIRQFFPELVNPVSYSCTYMICCDSDPIGIFFGHPSSDESKLDIKVDYTIPKFRDCSVGKYLYNHLANNGYRELSFDNPPKKHISYLKRMGFTNNDDESRFIKQL